MSRDSCELSHELRHCPVRFMPRRHITVDFGHAESTLQPGLTGAFVRRTLPGRGSITSGRIEHAKLTARRADDLAQLPTLRPRQLCLLGVGRHRFRKSGAGIGAHALTATSCGLESTWRPGIASRSRFSARQPTARSGSGRPRRPGPWLIRPGTGCRLRCRCPPMSNGSRSRPTSSASRTPLRRTSRRAVAVAAWPSCIRSASCPRAILGLRSDHVRRACLVRQGARSTSPQLLADGDLRALEIDVFPSEAKDFAQAEAVKHKLVRRRRSAWQARSQVGQVRLRLKAPGAMCFRGLHRAWLRWTSRGIG